MILIRTYDSVHCQFIVKSFIIVSLTLFSYLVLRIHLINKQRTPKTNESDIKNHSITHEKENVNVIKKITTNIVIHVMSRKTLHLLLQQGKQGTFLLALVDNWTIIMENYEFMTR